MFDGPYALLLREILVNPKHTTIPLPRAEELIGATLGVSAFRLHGVRAG